MNSELKKEIYELLLEVKREGVEGITSWYSEDFDDFLNKVETILPKLEKEL